MEVRAAKPEDIEAVYRLSVAAFGRKSEAKLVDQLRGVASTFSFVAVESEQIVGHIYYSSVRIEGDCADHLLLPGLAPVAVLPAY